MRRPLFVLVVVSLGGCVVPVDPCDGMAETCLAVHVDSSALDSVEELVVRASGSGLDAQRSTRSAGQPPVRLPAAVALLFPGVSDGTTLSLDLQVIAELDGRPVAAARGSAAVAAGHHAEAHLWLGSTAPPDGALTVRITSPAASAATNGLIAVEIATQPAEVDQVDLEIDGAVRQSWAGLSPFRLSWDTTGETEGLHRLVARATAGSFSVESDALVVQVDRTAPAVTASNPAAGQSWDTRLPLEVTFTKPIAPASAAAVSLTDGAGGAVPFKASFSGDQMALALDQIPTLPADVQLNMPASITDLAGNPLVQPTQWTFHLPAWLQDGNDVGTSVGPFQVSATPAGLMALTASYDAQSVTWYHVKRLDGATWKEYGNGFPTVPSSAGASSLEGLGMAGAPVVLYASRPDASTVDSHVVMTWDGAAWKPLGPPVFSGAGAATLATDGAGTIVVAYLAPDGNAPSAVYTVGWNAGAQRWDSLGPPVHHMQGGVDSPSLAIDANGDVLLAYRDHWFGSLSAFAGYYQGGQFHELGAGTTGAIDAFPGMGNGVGFPMLALDHQGRALVAFTESDAVPTRYLFVYRWEGSVWKQLAAGAPADVGVACSLTVDDQDRPIALYHDNKLKPNGYVIRWEPSAQRWVPLGQDAVGVGLKHPLTVWQGRAIVGVAATGKVFHSNQ